MESYSRVTESSDNLIKVYNFHHFWYWCITSVIFEIRFAITIQIWNSICVSFLLDCCLLRRNAIRYERPLWCNKIISKEVKACIVKAKRAAVVHYHQLEWNYNKTEEQLEDTNVFCGHSLLWILDPSESCHASWKLP